MLAGSAANFAANDNRKRGALKLMGTEEFNFQGVLILVQSIKSSQEKVLF